MTPEQHDQLDRLEKKINLIGNLLIVAHWKGDGRFRHEEWLGLMAEEMRSKENEK